MPRPVLVERWAGLDLRADPAETPGALDALNVVLEPGMVRTRDGMSALVTGLTDSVFLDSVEAGALGTHLIVAQTGAGSTYKAYDLSTGALLGTHTSLSSIQKTAGCSGVAIGTPTSTLYFIAKASAAFKWNPVGGWSDSAAVTGLNPFILSLSPTDNRLVVITNLGKVWFSDPGDPETFGANNFVQLTPGDGEEVSSAAVYGNNLFIFKRTKFFVFYGTSTASDGSPIFNYRVIDTGIGGWWNTTGQSCAVGPDGVYFVHRDGVYVTAGGAPVKISAPLDPFFAGGLGSTAYWQGGTLLKSTDRNIPGARVAALGRYVLVSLPTSTTDGLTFVYNIDHRAWMVWDMCLAGITPLTAHDQGSSELNAAVVGYSDGKIMRFSRALATDDGAAIVSRYRSGFTSFGDESPKVLRDVFVEASNAVDTAPVTLQWSTDWGSLGAAGALSLTPTAGNPPKVARQRAGARGRLFSYQIGAAAGSWQLNRMRLVFQDTARPPGVNL